MAFRARSAGGRVAAPSSLARLAAVAVLATVAALPFLSAAPTRSIDGPLHLFRLVELDHCISQGSFYPRWTPDLAQGYGFPLFNFYPPLAYYLAEAFHLVGLSLARSLNLVYLLSAALSAVAMYLLSADLIGERGGLLAAMLYVYAPFTIGNAVRRGGLAEVLAWALAPLALWAFRRLARRGQARWLVLASLSYAALLLTHHVSALAFTPLLLLVIVGSWPGRRSWQGLFLPALGLALGLGLSAFFALPAYLETRHVQIDRVFASAGFDFHYFFLTWRELLAGPTQTDITLMDPGFPQSAGWVQVGLAVAGCLAAFWTKDRSRRFWVLGASAVALALLFMMTVSSVRVWEALPLLGYLQYPWRLLAPLSLVLAFVGGSLSSSLPARGSWGWAGAVGIAAVTLSLFVYDTSLLYYPRQPLRSPNPSLADVLEFERSSWLLSLTSNLDYLPVAVQELPGPSPMAAQYAAASEVTWLDTPSLPPGVDVPRAVYRLNDMRLAFESPHPFRAIINQYYFPGWQAYVDGSRVQAIAVAPHGLIGVDMPAGSHELRLRFEDTPLRRASSLVSLVSALALVVAAGLVWRNGSAAPALDEPAGGRALPAWAWALLLALTAGYLGLKGGVLDRRDSWFKVARLQGTQVRGMQTARQINFGNEMLLLGYDLPAPAVEAGDRLAVDVYWKALRKIAAEYSVSLQLVDGQGRLRAQGNSYHPGGVPTVRWELDTYVRDPHEVVVPPGTPPGDYSIRVSVYPLRGSGQLDVLDANGLPTGTVATLGIVKIIRPANPPALAALGMQEAAPDALNDDLQLLGYNVPREPVRPGQRVGFTLFWRAIRRPRADYQALIGLGDAQVTASFPVAGQPYPSSAWQPGEIVRAEYDILIPAETPPGANTLHVALADSAGSPGRPVAIGQLEVLPISHRMDIPAMGNRVDASLGDRITLLGYDLDSREVGRGESLHLRLYWQARGPMAQEYKVFTHLLDAQDRISAQQDGVPAQGSRPTTSWIEGEVIVDEYTLTVHQDAPVGEHRLEIGIYDPASGQRLAVYGRQGEPQGDRVLLGAVEVR